MATTPVLLSDNNHLSNFNSAFHNSGTTQNKKSFELW